MRTLSFSVFFPFLFTLVGFTQNRPLVYFGQTTYGAGVVANMIGRGIPATADINNDGIADVGLPLLQNFQVGTAVIRNGEFGLEMQPHAYFEDGQIYLRIQFEDLTGDGYKELTLNRYDSNNSFEPYLFKNEAGIIEGTRMPVPAVFPQGIPMQFGHFNNDEITDGAYFDGNLYLLDGSDGSEYEIPFTTGRTFLMDFNGDGLTDVLNAQYYSAVHSAYGHLLLLGKGDFSFEEYLTIGNVNIDGFGDFDGDGVLDIIDWDRGMAFNLKLNLKSQNQPQNTAWTVNTVNQDKSLAVYDLNQDGLDDVILFGRDSTYYCQTQPDLSFRVFATKFGNGGQKFFTRDKSWPLGTVVGQDGSGGLVYYHLSFENNAFQAEDRSDRILPPMVNTVPYRFDLLSTDRDDDQKQELWVNAGKKFLIGELNEDKFENHDYFFPDVSLISAVTTLISADFDKDGLEDIIYGEPNFSSQITMLKGQSDTSFFPPVVLADSFTLGFKMQVADLNQDGWDDFVATGGKKFSVFLNQGNGVFHHDTLLSQSTENWDFIDPNFDNYPDLAITLGDSIHIFLNDQQANFTHAGQFSGILPHLKQKVTNEFYRFRRIEVGNFTTHYLERIAISPDADIYQSKAFRTFNGANYRTAFQMDYDLDGIPDFMCHYGDDALIIYGDTADLLRFDYFENTRMVGFVDLNQDTIQDVFWEVGSQHFVELVNAPLPSPTKEIEPVDLNIFPNPAHHYIHFDLLDPSIVQWILIYDDQGRLVQSKRNPGNRIDIGNLPAGNYFVKGIQSLRQQFSGQFLKVK